jgi:hypothetical protein
MIIIGITSRSILILIIITIVIIMFVWNLLPKSFIDFPSPWINPIFDVAGSCGGVVIMLMLMMIRSGPIHVSILRCS